MKNFTDALISELVESTLTPLEKMKLLNKGEYRNIAAMSEQKLRDNQFICKQNNLFKALFQIENEMYRRGILSAKRSLSSIDSSAFKHYFDFLAAEVIKNQNNDAGDLVHQALKSSNEIIFLGICLIYAMALNFDVLADQLKNAIILYGHTDAQVIGEFLNRIINDDTIIDTISNILQGAGQQQMSGQQIPANQQVSSDFEIKNSVLIKYKGTDTDVTIPNSVTSIGYCAFYYCSSLKSITIPDSVNRIGGYAFRGCESIPSIYIPNTVTSIGDNAFEDCKSLIWINIPNSVSSIGDRAFLGCSSLIIYCEAATKPSGWSSRWNLDNRPVVWGSLQTNQSNTLRESTIDETIEKHNKLNPKLWNEDNTLKLEVEEKINLIVKDFLDGLAENDIKFKLGDVKLVGSNCSYNYNSKSDLDLHLFFDLSIYDDAEKQDMAKMLYDYNRKFWNDAHDVDFYGIPVELFVETSDAIKEDPAEDALKEAKQQIAVTSNGIYSVLNKKWIKEPILADIPDVDEEALNTLVGEWTKKYNEVVASNNIQEIENFIDSIYELRKSSIANEGEYGLGNLCFKECRAAGYINNLKELKGKLKSKELSLESLKENVEVEDEELTQAKAEFAEFVKRLEYTGTPKVFRDKDNNIIYSIEYAKSIKGNDLFDWTEVEPDEWEDWDYDYDEDGVPHSYHSSGISAKFDEDHILESWIDELIKTEQLLDPKDDIFEYSSDDSDFDNDIEVGSYYYDPGNYSNPPEGEFGLAGTFDMSATFYYTKKQTNEVLTESTSEQDKYSQVSDFQKSKQKWNNYWLNYEDKEVSDNFKNYNNWKFDIGEKVSLNNSIQKGNENSNEKISGKIIDRYIGMPEFDTIPTCLWSIKYNNMDDHKGEYYLIRLDYPKLFKQINKFNTDIYYLEKAEDSIFKSILAEMISDKDRYELRNKITRVAEGNQPIIQDNGLFHIYNIKQNDVDRIINRLKNEDYIEEVHSVAGRYDFSRPHMLPGQLPDRYYTISGRIKDTSLTEDLTPEEKVDKWNDGTRIVAKKNCSAEKLKKYGIIALTKGYDNIVNEILDELEARGETAIFNELDAKFAEMPAEKARRQAISAKKAAEEEAAKKEAEEKEYNRPLNQLIRIAESKAPRVVTNGMTNDEVESWEKKLFEDIVSESGGSDTVAAEMLSAWNYGSYRLLNDGDWWYGWGNTFNTNSKRAMNYLKDHISLGQYSDYASNEDDFIKKGNRAILNKIFKDKLYLKPCRREWRSYPVAQQY